MSVRGRMDASTAAKLGVSCSGFFVSGIALPFCWWSVGARERGGMLRRPLRVLASDVRLDVVEVAAASGDRANAVRDLVAQPGEVALVGAGGALSGVRLVAGSPQWVMVRVPV